MSDYAYSIVFLKKEKTRYAFK